MFGLNDFKNTLDAMRHADGIMPVLFIGHGSPMNAVEQNEFSQSWNAIGRSLPAPKAILCVSAHWETDGTFVTMSEHPRTIHDFYGFPEELFQKQYPAPGAPDTARETMRAVSTTHVRPDDDRWGLDHGTWSVLAQMYPSAEIPVFQLSLDRTQSPRRHYELARELAGLRAKGVLVIGSGNIVHNLRVMRWDDAPYDWAAEFDQTAKKLLIEGDNDALIDYERLGKAAQLSIPTNEHYLPLLYAIALQGRDEPLQFFTEKTVLGSVSMRSLMIG